jgi:ArsR family transcriptional regulator, virulence genes transcriptional regulator
MDKKKFYIIHSEVCKTLANPKRQEILDNLRHKEMTVNELVEITGITQANLSQHLAILRAKGILLTRRNGINVHYRLSNPKIMQAFDLISEILKDSSDSQSETIHAAIDHEE